MKFTGIENKKYWVNFLGTKGWGDMSSWMKSWFKREKHIKMRGFCILTTETCLELTTILEGRNVLDAGAGTGYIMYHLKKRGIIIDGVVKSKKAYQFKRNFMTKRLIKDDYTTMDLSKYNAFILSWPDYEGTHAEVFLNRLKSGDKLVYQGESNGGCCATYEFFDILERDFTEVEKETVALNKNHVRFAGIHDHWAVYIKN